MRIIIFFIIISAPLSLGAEAIIKPVAVTASRSRNPVRFLTRNVIVIDAGEMRKSFSGVDDLLSYAA